MARKGSVEEGLQQALKLYGDHALDKCLAQYKAMKQVAACDESVRMWTLAKVIERLGGTVEE